MISAVAWKQWREQRLLAGILLLVEAAVLIILRFTAPAPISPNISYADVTFMAAFVAGAYGVIGGALLLAGDQEGRTQGFLEQLIPSRLSLWSAKVFVGTGFTLLHSLMLGAILYSIWSDTLQPGDVARQSWGIPFYALIAFSWGACASALLQTVPVALLIGGLLAGAHLLVGWFLIRPEFVSEPGKAELLAGLVAAGAALLASALFHCWVDMQRSRGDFGQRPFWTGPRSARALRVLWLSWRQGWPILLLLSFGFVVGWWLPTRAMLLWPVVTLAGGLIIGSSLLERRQGQEFLQEQGLVGRAVWLLGTFTRLVLAASFGGLVLCGVWLQQLKVDPRVPKKPPFLERAMGIREERLVGTDGPPALPPVNSAVFLTLWLLVGFSVGRLGILFFARKAITVGVGLPAAILLAGVWIPSILNQGLLWWQALMPCAALLLGCVLVDCTQWALAWRVKAIVVTSCLIVALGWVAGVLWYRATELPDTKEPFDVAEFADNLVPPEHDRVGSLLVQTAKEFKLHLLTTTRQLGRPDAVPSPNGTPLLPTPVMPWGYSADRIRELQQSNSIWDWIQVYRLQLEESHWNGWPDRATKLERWVDGIFEGEWIRHLETLNGLPSRMCIGDWDSGTNSYTIEVKGGTVTGSFLEDTRNMVKLLCARALQYQRRRQFRSALDCYRTILTLSRHLRERGESFNLLIGVAYQQIAFASLEQWAYGVDEEGLLHQALQEVNEQEESSTPLVNLVCGHYYWIVQRVLSDPAALHVERTDSRWTQRLFLLTRLAPPGSANGIAAPSTQSTQGCSSTPGYQPGKAGRHGRSKSGTFRRILWLFRPRACPASEQLIAAVCVVCRPFACNWPWRSTRLGTGAVRCAWTKSHLNCLPQYP
jgi:hypothetical protein